MIKCKNILCKNCDVDNYICTKENIELKLSGLSEDNKSCKMYLLCKSGKYLTSEQVNARMRAKYEKGGVV